MKQLILAALVFSAAPATAQEEVKTPGPEANTAPPAAAARPEPAPLKYSPELRQAARNLALLLERGAEVPPEKLDALAPELARFNGELEAALGRDLLAEAARREKELADTALAEEAKLTLQEFRSSLQVYYVVNNGKYPADPSRLTPGRMNAVPELRLPGHEATAKVTVIDSARYDKDFTKAVTDSGGWLYFSNQDSVNYGLLLIDCRHTAPDGTEFFKY